MFSIVCLFNIYVMTCRLSMYERRQLSTQGVRYFSRCRIFQSVHILKQHFKAGEWGRTRCGSVVTTMITGEFNCLVHHCSTSHVLINAFYMQVYHDIVLWTNFCKLKANPLLLSGGCPIHVIHTIPTHWLFESVCLDSMVNHAGCCPSRK